LEWTDLEFIRDIILILATQGWQKLADEETQSADQPQSGYDEPIRRLTSRFKVPLEAAGGVVGLIIDEFRDMLSYATVHFLFQH
jgi:hypothetical protein